MEANQQTTTTLADLREARKITREVLAKGKAGFDESGTQGAVFILGAGIVALVWIGLAFWLAGPSSGFLVGAVAGTGIVIALSLDARLNDLTGQLNLLVSLKVPDCENQLAANIAHNRALAEEENE